MDTRVHANTPYMSVHMHAYIYVCMYAHNPFSEPFEKTCCPLTHTHYLLLPKTKDILLYYYGTIIKSGC